MSIIDELAEYFKKFPGVGPRQAGRFVYYLLNQKPEYVDAMIKKIKSLETEMIICPECFQYHLSKNQDDKVCAICNNKNRDNNQLLVISSDVDLKTIEKSNTYNGLYFVLGGTVSITEKEPETKIRLRSLRKKVEESKNEISEIIIALSANPEGENTADLVKEYLKVLSTDNNIKVSILGRGLSTGSEIEYADSETLKNALNNRL